jgi:hypothetical protein
MSVAHRMNDGFLALHMRELGASGIAGLISGSVGGAIFDSADSFTLYRIGAFLSFLTAVNFIVMHMQRERQRITDLEL